ncbi:MAG: hypothetical protein QW613_06850, partial [Thermoprotei archaeon]
MQSLPTTSQEARSLRLLNFSFRHRTDWTRLTKAVKCDFQSLGWFPLKEEFNYEVGLLKWQDREQSPLEFFEKTIMDGFIYSLEQLEPVWHNTYLVGFLGPYANTVREKILEYDVGLYFSNIRGGMQQWTIVIQKSVERGFIEELKRIGNLNVVTSRTPTHEELYSLLQSNISA